MNDRPLFFVVLVVFVSLPTFAQETIPYHGKPHVIPGLIEAEHWDKGPSEQAYHDSDAQNRGEDYRESTQVDIEKRDDASNGHGVGWTKKGEWLIYTVEVARAGKYDVEFPVASNKRGGTFHLEMGGKDVTGEIEVPDTGSWQTLKKIYKRGIFLEQGRQKMKLVMDSEGPSNSIGDIDYIKFTVSKED